MGIVNGQAVNETITNAAFLSKNANDTTNFKLGLDDGDLTLVSGTAVANSQRELNSLWSFIGGLINQAKDYVPTWTSQNFGGVNDSIKEKIEALDAGLGGRTGEVSIGIGSASVAVNFSTAWADANYIPTISFFCSDVNPIFLQSSINSITSAGFTVTLSAPTDSANYKLFYRISKAV